MPFKLLAKQMLIKILRVQDFGESFSGGSMTLILMMKTPFPFQKSAPLVPALPARSIVI